MARYEHLPIYREAYDLTLHIEKIVQNFSRYHKYTLGTDLRNGMRGNGSIPTWAIFGTRPYPSLGLAV